MYLIVALSGWIGGISTMGRDIPVVGSSIIFICLILNFLFLISIVLKFSFHQQLWFKILNLICLSITCIILGMLFAEQALSKRLANRVTEVKNTEAIVYIKNINQLKQKDSLDHSSTLNNKIQQKIWVLNQGAEPVQWMAYVNAPESTLQLGHYYKIQGSVRPVHGYAVAGVFDQEKWRIQDNIAGIIQVSSYDEISESQVEYPYFIEQQKTWIARASLMVEQSRLNFRKLIDRQHFSHSGLILALLTGDQSLLNEAEQNRFKRLGISHLLAISGPHVLIFAGFFVCFLTLFINRFKPTLYLSIPKTYCMVLPFCLCVWGYTAFVGFEIPALRTFITVTLVALLLLIQQQLQSIKILLMSASLLLLYDPFSILSVAFWLSYGACFILIRIYQTISQQSAFHLHSRFQRIKFVLKVFVDSQWKIFIALFPLVIVIFKQISWVSPLSNLIAIPMLGTLIVPIDVMAAILSLFSKSLGIFMFNVADWGLSILNYLLNILDITIHAKLSWIAFTTSTIICIALAVFILFLPKYVIPKFWALICFFPAFLPFHRQESFELTVIDVGQGQAVLVQLPERNILIDTGGYYDENKFSIGEQIIVPYLTYKGISRLDQVILSHLDQDHSGAFSKISENIDIGEVYASERDERFRNDKFQFCYSGQHWDHGQVKIQILNPEKNSLSNTTDDRNEHSCVVYIQVPFSRGYQNFLIMGDAGWASEFQILQTYPDLKVDVLILGHHGSEHSSAYDFLEKLHPQLAIVSAGFNNRYQHPARMTLQRLQRLNIPLKSTIEKGSIHFTIKENGEMKIENYRDKWKWLKR